MEWAVLALLAAGCLVAVPLRAIAGAGEPALGFQVPFAFCGVGLWAANIYENGLQGLTWGTFAMAIVGFAALTAAVQRLAVLPMGRTRRARVAIGALSWIQWALFAAAAGLAAVVGVGLVSFG